MVFFLHHIFEVFFSFFKEMALVSVSRLATVLKTQSDSNAGFFAIKEAAASILGAIGNVVISSTSMASVDADETNENITGYTGNSTDKGVVSSKERVSDNAEYPVNMPAKGPLKYSVFLDLQYRLLHFYVAF